MDDSQELKQEKRTYRGGIAGELLVAYLNNADSSETTGRVRVTEIMRKFHALLCLLGSHSDWVSASRDTYERVSGLTPRQISKLINKGLRSPGLFPEKPADIEAAERELADAIACYERRPSFGLTHGDWEFSWGITLPNLNDADQDDGATIAESKAVDALIELGRERLLSHVQRCECGKWFFAKFSHQHFCSARCRDRHNQSLPEFKEQRRKYMRKYYQKRSVK